MQWPEDYPFPAVIQARARDFKYASFLRSRYSSWLTPLPQSRMVHRERNWSLVYPSHRRTSSAPLSVPMTSLTLAQFYCEEHANIGEAFARFAFCKDEDTLRAAAQRLQGLKKYIKKP